MPASEFPNPLVKQVTDNTQAIATLNANGTILAGTNNATSVSVADDTATIINSMTLARGCWIVVGCADWYKNANGYRQIAFNSNEIDPGRNLAVTTVGLDNKETYQQVVFIKNTAGETFSLYARQTSGVTLSVYPHLYAVKISDYHA